MERALGYATERVYHPARRLGGARRTAAEVSRQTRKMLKQRFAKEEGGVPPWVPYAVIALAVMTGGYFIYAAWTKGDRPLASTLMCLDAKCGATQERVMEVGEEWPQVCPKCGKKTLIPAVLCRKCKAPLILNENRGLPPPTKCPKCGQENRHGS